MPSLETVQKKTYATGIGGHKDQRDFLVIQFYDLVNRNFRVVLTETSLNVGTILLKTWGSMIR